MNELLLKAQKLKISIESDINQLSLSDFTIPLGTQNAIQVYQQKSLFLENHVKQIRDKLQQLKSQLISIQDSAPDGINKRKLDNIMQMSREIEQNLTKTYRNKSDKLNTDKDRIQIFGERDQSSKDNISLLVDQGRSLDASHQMVEDSLQIGQDVLMSFSRQQSALKSIQSKVNTIIGDMGLSSGLIRIMGSRDQQDKRIIILLTVILAVFLIALYYTFK